MILGPGKPQLASCFKVWGTQREGSCCHLLRCVGELQMLSQGWGRLRLGVRTLMGYGEGGTVRRVGDPKP